MKKLVLIGMMALSVTSYADSERDLKNCVTAVYRDSLKASGIEAKELIALVNESVRECRESVRETVRAEKDKKKAERVAKRVAKMKKELAKLEKSVN